MGKLRLAIADGDTEYLSKLEKYLIVNYPRRFDIISLASREELAVYLNSSDRPDILLICNDMKTDCLVSCNAARTIILDGESALTKSDGYDAVNKFQNADRLVADVLRLYAAGRVKEYATPGNGRTSIICVCSPSGGAGKSSIAAGCSILCEGRGTRAFYLDLEAMPSSELFFQSDTIPGRNFSSVIYHLKGKNGNMGLKLEGASSMDKKTGVHYFAPPENLMEMNELTEQDVTLLLDTFRESPVYDMVFADIDCGFNPINTAVMMKADVILLILTPEQSSSLKYGEFMKSLEYIRGSHNKGPAKIVTVLNRAGPNGEENVSRGLFEGFNPEIAINEIQITASGGYPTLLTENVPFLSGISGICECLTPVTAASAPFERGEDIAF